MRARAARLPPNADTRFTTSVDARSELLKSRPYEYFGNLSVPVVATCPIDVLLKGPFLLSITLSLGCCCSGNPQLMMSQKFKD